MPEDRGYPCSITPGNKGLLFNCARRQRISLSNYARKQRTVVQQRQKTKHYFQLCPTTEGTLREKSERIPFRLRQKGERTIVQQRRLPEKTHFQPHQKLEGTLFITCATASDDISKVIAQRRNEKPKSPCNAISLAVSRYYGWQIKGRARAQLMGDNTGITTK